MGPYQWTPEQVAIELLDTQVFFGVRSVGPVGDFLDFLIVFFFFFEGWEFHLRLGDCL